MELLQENEAAREFLKLLIANRLEMGQEYSALLRRVDSMAWQLDAALRELQEVKAQLAGMQEDPVKQAASRVAGPVEGKLHAVKEHLTGIKDRIVEGAKEAVEGFRHMGIAALDRAVSGLGIKRLLEAVQGKLERSAAEMEKSIEKIGSIGSEMRNVGGHVKNIARAVAGKELQAVGGGREGRFQAAVLAPMRLEKRMIDRLCNTAYAAIGGVERLEQAAGRGRETGKAAPPREAGTLKTSREAGKREEKPSVISELQEKRKEAAARPAPDIARKPQEAAL